MRYRKIAFLTLCTLLHCATQQVPLLQPGYDYSKIKTITIQDVKDFPYAKGSGEIVFNALSDRLMEIGIEIAEIQNPSNTLLICSISDFTDQRTKYIPLEITDKGSTAAKNAYAEADKSGKPATDKKDTHIGETITRTKEIKYIDTAVGVKLQLLDVGKSMIVWSSDFTYSGLNQTEALNKCIDGAVRPLKHILKK